jgi:alpha-mannosidase
MNYKLCLLISAFLLYVNVNGQEKPKSIIHKKTVLHVVGYAHLDSQWVWDYQTTIDNYLKNTLKDNFRLIEKYPDYIFNFSGANRYYMFKEYYPEEYAVLKKYIASGRWFPCGSSMEENDVMVPSPESTIRQILYGNHFFRKEFGKASEEYMLPDCFGFPYSLPSVLSHCGLKGFSTQKLTWGSAVGIPFNIGNWTGPDGESVVAAFNPGGYGETIRKDLANDENWLKRITANGDKYGLYADYMYYGTGDRGGSPTEQSVIWLEKSLKSDGAVKVISARADQFFSEITPDEKAKLPNYKGELLLTQHSAGSITSAAFMKKCNRKNELLAYSAEATSVIAECIGRAKYPQLKINNAWRLVLGGQFHDILPGTSIPRAYEFSWNDEILAMNQFSNVLCDASGAIISVLNTNVSGVPLVVYNPLSFDRTDIVEAEVLLKEPVLQYIKVYDNNNKEVASQIVEISENKAKIIFDAEVPSLGFAVYNICSSETPSDINKTMSITYNSIENSGFKIMINENGDISSIYDKKASREILIEPVRLAFQHNKPAQYPAWNMDWNDQKKAPIGFVDGKPLVSILENGSARVSLEITREARDSRFIQQIRLSESNPSVIEIFNKIDWYSKGVALKASFPFAFSNSKATYDCGLGVIQRGNNDSVKYEVPFQQWMDLTDVNASYGVSIFTESKYGSDKPSDNTLRLTLMYTPETSGDYNNQSTQDFGKHEITYAVFPHKNECNSTASTNEAAKLNQPLIAFQTNQHEGYLGKSFSFLKINNSNLIVKAIKKAEDSDEIIVRVFETSGKSSAGNKISFAAAVVSAKEVNGQEQFIADAKVSDGKLVFDITAWHPKTFAIKLAQPKIKDETVKSKIIDLQFNTDVISTENAKNDGSMDISKATYPAEMLATTIVSEGIEFNIGPKSGKSLNAMSCQGQKIALPQGNYNSLYLLAASSSDDSKEIFKLDNQPTAINIQKWYGFIGQWDNRLWHNYTKREADYSFKGIEYIGLTPGFVKTANVAWFASHRHLADGKNDPYIYSYMFKYKINIPAGAKELLLPDNSNIKIFAITAAYNENDFTFPVSELYDALNISKLEYDRFQIISPPAISPKSMIIEKSKSFMVNLHSPEKNSEILFTTDGSEPDNKSAVYKNSILVDKPMTIKAAVFKNGVKSSFTTTGDYWYIVHSMNGIQHLNKGLNYALYQGEWDVLPDFDKLKPVKTGVSKTVDISSMSNNDDFGFVFEGYINIPKNDIYTFSIASDDGSRLIIDDNYVTDNDKLHGTVEVSNTFPLESGYHKIKVLFFENSVDEELHLYWSSDEIKKEEVPANVLFH